MANELEALRSPDDFTNAKTTEWTRRIEAYAAKLFDKASSEYYYMSEISFSLANRTGNVEQDISDAIDEAQRRVQLGIDSLVNFDVYHPPRKNMLESWSNGFILFLLGVLGTGAFLAGKYTTDMSTMELRRELKDLRDSVRTASANPPPAVIIHDTIWLELDSSQHMRHEAPSQDPNK